MKKILSLSLLAMLVLFTACEPEIEWPDADQIAAPELLTSSPWNLDAIVGWEMDDGVRNDATYDLFGENTDNGICTFTFEETECTMDDEGELETDEYFFFANNTMILHNELYHVTKLTETELELTTGLDDPEAMEGETMRMSRE